MLIFKAHWPKGLRSSILPYLNFILTREQHRKQADKRTAEWAWGEHSALFPFS